MDGRVVGILVLWAAQGLAGTVIFTVSLVFMEIDSLILWIF